MNIWKNYIRAWIETYKDFIIYYIELTENWLRFGTAAHAINVALGLVTVVNEVDTIGENVAQKTNHSNPR
jgi:hypothetical protein